MRGDLHGTNTRGARSRWRACVAAVAGANTVAALAGALSLAVGWLSLSDELTSRLPFGSPVLGGVALAALVGLPNLLLTVLALRRDPRTAAASVVVGALLVGWIAVEVAFLRVVAGLQVFYALVGVLQVWLGLRLGRHDPGVRPRALVRMVLDVVSDIPRFLTAPLHRRRHLRWGATDDEVAAGMPGDELVPDAPYSATRAITINAAPEAVWPWLTQVGADRAGYYSDDLLDHRGEPSARDIISAWQDPTPGDLVTMSATTPPPEGTFFRVDSLEPCRWLLWRNADATWSWRLTPTANDGTRLVTRVHVRYDWRHPVGALLGVALMELGDFAMMRRMLIGLRDRAEAANVPVPSQ